MAATTQAALLLVFVSIVCGDEGITRKLNVTQEWDTSCMAQLNDEARCAGLPLVHVTATSAQDTLHALVSLWAAPSCLLLKTPLDAQLSLNWTALSSGDTAGGVTADVVLAAYGVSLDQLIEFDDPEDRADLTHDNATRMAPLALNMSLDARQLKVTSAKEMVVIEIKAPLNSSFWPGTVGNVTFRVEVLNSDRRTDELPHLQETGNSIVAGVVLDKLLTNSGFKHSRFGIQLTTVGNETQKLAETESLDDEYTPGVFKLISLSSAAADAGFLQWRPVAYTSSEYTIEHSTTARHYKAQDAAGLVSPLLTAFNFGATQQARQLNLTFGLSEDGWYTDTKYAAWETTVGLGTPPTDQFSIMVILLLGIGLGLPTVALIGGGVWMAVRKVRGQSSAASRLLAEEE